MTKRDKIYFVSDVHLGSPALSNNRERERLFADWLHNISSDARELYLMGDIFDFWFEFRKVVPRGYTRVLGRLAELTDMGISVHFFTGNHDMWVFDYLPQEIGVIVHKEPLITELMGKKFFLAHGDGLDKSDTGYLLLKKIFSNPFLQWLYARLHPNFSLHVAQLWSTKSRKNKKPNKTFDPTSEGMYRYAASLLKREHFDFFVMGHRHKMVQIPIGTDSHYVLLGDWIEAYSYGVFDGEKFELKKLKL